MLAMLSLSVSTVIKLSVGTLGWTSGICCSSLSPHLHIKDTVPHNALCHTKDTVPYRALRHTNTYRALSHIKDTVSYRAFCFCNISNTIRKEFFVMSKTLYPTEPPFTPKTLYSTKLSVTPRTPYPTELFGTSQRPLLLVLYGTILCVVRI